jgi:hypothetical protein
MLSMMLNYDAAINSAQRFDALELASAQAMFEKQEQWGGADVLSPGCEAASKLRFAANADPAVLMEE